uniref:exo-beta-N-acetylmuramidase NamZ family protein n=2 Tax=Gelidibacter sp. TaxID=2018083 RepID=UPI00404AAFEA
MLLTMFKNTFFPITIGIVLVAVSCGNISKKENEVEVENEIEIVNEVNELQTIQVGANQTEAYLPLLKGKRVGIVANQTTVVFKKTEDGRQKTEASYTHLVDSLVSLKVDVKKVYAPEHGFRGTADAGELIKDGLDTKTGLPIISLYGDNKKPKPAQLQGIDVMIFDVQDVGARFYTYISSLHYVMEACAEAKIPLLILDRPNPNGHIIDGPILEKEHQSFVGMHPIPVLHGMTIAEYAKMINGEKWLKNGVQCELMVIPVKNYSRDAFYSLPIKPSPNLPNDQAINLYASLCFFEGTNVSVGRGTSQQFQIFGSPFLDKKIYEFSFKPKPNEGAKSPMHQGKLCFGKDLSKVSAMKTLELSYLIEAYKNTADKTVFFNTFFTKLAGTKNLQKQIEQGLSEQEIKASWQAGLEQFKTKRQLYLLYP